MRNDVSFLPGIDSELVPREQEMLKGHPLRVIYYHVYQYTKRHTFARGRSVNAEL